MSAHAEKFRRGLIESGRIRASDLRPLAQIACEHCIQSGIDHVLVGMRTVNYVDTLKMLF